MSPQIYEKLSGTLRTHGDSSPDVTIPFIASEKAGRWEESYERDARRDWRDLLAHRLKVLRWIVEAGLVAAVVFLLVQRKGAGRPEFAGDITGFAPRFTQRLVRFEPNYDFVPENMTRFLSEETLNRWLDLVPKGLGFLEIQDPSKYNDLPTPLEEYVNKTVYASSMTHQLHCLHSIIDSHTRLALGWPVDPDYWHVQHCFEYLRQSIMCYGDVALEGAETTFPDRKRGGSDGWDATHVCKDYGEVYTYLEGARAKDKNWI
ncbi:uncharacterized protein DNG_09593 [Cephalotrichum gorgonifer]|uniref:Oxidase ustYa n=1 Tax=Cephalotrichum gorgonifer TaxID=2041049 RepID=A0AAE8SZH1_9PEZI|nr:uncharacterized protein DNG_09593 [Cephalotrichum gorgonifer]